MKEMLGGCCVCSDDRGWTENPLVYCDGQGCTVAVHQACYGIVTVPPGPWFCRKCESQERAAKVKCELCPSKDGALKRTDNSGWAHVVCALYIPEVRFGNVSTMEPIILSMVPAERFNKICYICESQGRESKAKNGACMNCNKSGCKYHFHVTCAQSLGLLCEEAGNYVDNVKYCGYCQHHYSKLKKGSNLKTIPAFKPLPAPGSNDGQEKGGSHGNTSWSSHQSSSGVNGNKDKNRKKPGRKSSSNSQISPKAGNSRDALNSSVIVEAQEAEETKKTFKTEPAQFTDVLAGVGLVPGPKASASEPVNASGTSHSELLERSEFSKSSDYTKTIERLEAKKDKQADHSKSGTDSHSEAVTIPDRSRATKRKNSMRSVSPTSLGGNDTESTLSNVSDCGPSVAFETFTSGEQKSGDHTADPELNASVVHSVIVSSSAMHQSENAQLHPKNNATPQRSVSPLTITGIQSAGANSKLQVEQSRSSYSSICSNAEKDHNGPISASKKPRKGRTPKLSAPLAPDSPPSSPDSSAGVDQLAKRRKKLPRNSASVLPRTDQNQSPVILAQNERPSENPEQPSAFLVPIDAHKMSEVSRSNAPVTDRYGTSISTETPVHYPLSVSITPSNKTIESNSSAGQDNTKLAMPKEPHTKQNGIVAPHMLGNIINPTSNVAQKMTETLTAELDAHNVSHESPSRSKPIVGVPFPPRPSSPSLKLQPSQSLEHLLERQWEQSSLFLMEQAQHFDIATLLSHLHSLQIENRKLEDRVATLTKRREHLLSVKARLSIPLSMNTVNSFISGGSLSDRSPQGPSVLPSHLTHNSPHERERRSASYLSAVENGVGPSEHISPYVVAGFPSPHPGQRAAKDCGIVHQNDRVIPSPVIVSSRGTAMYHPMAPGNIVPPTMSPVQSGSNFLADGRGMMVQSSPSSTPEMRPEMIRTSSTPSQHLLHSQPYAFQMVSPAIPGPTLHSSPLMGGSLQGAVATSQQHGLNARRDVPDPRHTMGRPKSIEHR